MTAIPGRHDVIDPGKIAGPEYRGAAAGACQKGRARLRGEIANGRETRRGVGHARYRRIGGRSSVDPQNPLMGADMSPGRAVLCGLHTMFVRPVHCAAARPGGAHRDAPGWRRRKRPGHRRCHPYSRGGDGHGLWRGVVAATREKRRGTRGILKPAECASASKGHRGATHDEAGTGTARCRDLRPSGRGGYRVRGL